VKPRVQLPIWRIHRHTVLTGGFAPQELTDAGAISVFESVGVLRQRLDVTALR